MSSNRKSAKAKSAKGARITGGGLRDGPWEDRPTSHLPGTTGKIEAMRRRAEEGLPIFNAADARIPDGDNRADEGPRTVEPLEHSNHRFREALYRKWLEAFDQLRGLPSTQRGLPSTQRGEAS